MTSFFKIEYFNPLTEIMALMLIILCTSNHAHSFTQHTKLRETMTVYVIIFFD